MKKQIKKITSLASLLLATSSFGQFVITPAAPNTNNLTTNGNVGIGTGTSLQAARLQVLGTANQFRLGNATLFADINQNASGLIFTPSSSANKVAFGIASPASGVGFHSNVGVFRISDPASATRAVQFNPNYPGLHDIPAGALVTTPITLPGEGLTFIPSGGGGNGIKLGACVYDGSRWRSVWETANYLVPSSSNVGPTLLLVKSGGNVGIGTGVPAARLHVNNLNLGTSAGNSVNWANFSGNVGNNDQLKIINKRVKNGSSWWTSEIRLQRTVDVTDVSFMSFRSTGTDATYAAPAIVFGYGNTDYMSIDDQGKVKIGTRSQTGTHSDAKLAVDGKVVAQSLYITASNWADYVFAKGYELPNLYDVEKYYLANKHLPEIPSEKEVIENGIDVGEMNKLLLKKIEELTILMVKQQKEIDLLKIK
jgi:hypothetical protein